MTLPPDLLVPLTAGVFAIAVLYSLVGHAGASGYIAVMTLLAVPPPVIRPAALALNILVASIAFGQFYRGGHFAWPRFWPFAVAAVPCAFVGGAIQIPSHLFKVVLGAVLLYSALRFVWAPQSKRPLTEPPRWLAVGCGAAIGLLAGLTGTGGGIFLTPLLLLMGWAEPQQAAAVSALFILVNSAAGLAGNFSATQSLPQFVVPLFAAAGLGGALGSHLGSRRLGAAAIKRFLAVVLAIAGLKLVLS